MLIEAEFAGAKDRSDEASRADEEFDEARRTRDEAAAHCFDRGRDVAEDGDGDSGFQSRIS